MQDLREAIAEVVVVRGAFRRWMEFELGLCERAGRRRAERPSRRAGGGFVEGGSSFADERSAREGIRR